MDGAFEPSILTEQLDLGLEIARPLERPPALPRRRGRDLLAGIQLLPEQRLGAFSPLQLEMVVAHWLHENVARRYARVIRFGGPGDKGRDVVGYESAQTDDPWDNYQCKQLTRNLAPGDVWAELGKLIYWTGQGTFSVPRRYTFVAPRGAGPRVHDLLSNVEALRAGLIENWPKHCGGLSALKGIQETIAVFAFPELDLVTGMRIVEDLKDSAIYPVLFGGGLTKPRPPDRPPPEQIAGHELPYIGCLIDAYDDHCPEQIAGADDALTHAEYGPHLRDSRRDFYCAESLREFSKDVLVEPDDFKSLQNEMYHGVKHTAARDFDSGYERVLEVCEQATVVQVSDHPLRSDLNPADRSGMCHQLANDGRLVWKRL
jgi:hypothetical protein